jgi:multiple RNA-binding domain-containing protein 1
MSRICVKNIGKTTTDKQLKELFSTKGEVTDVRIVKTKSGKSRQFAFIGFRSDVQAKEAISYYNNTFLDTSRISVEPAMKVGDPALLEGSRSRHTKKKLEKLMKEKNASSIIDAKPSKKPSSDKNKKDAPSKEMSDFLEAMKPRRNTQFWANDESLPSAGATDGDQSDESAELKKTQKSSALKDSNVVGKGSHKMDVDDSDSDDGNDEDDVNDFTKQPPEPVKSVKKGVVSDLDYLRSKVSAHFSDDEDEGLPEGGETDEGDSDSDDDDDDDDDGIRKVKNDGPKKRTATVKRPVDSDTDDGDDDKHEEDNKNANKAASGIEKGTKLMDVVKSDVKDKAAQLKKWQTEDATKASGADDDDDIDASRLFIRNLTFTCSEDEIRSLFEAFGRLASIHLPLDTEKKGKGFGFVQFIIPEHATKARNDLDGTSFQGRVLHVIHAKKVPEPAEKSDDKKSHGGRLSAFQQKKEDERKLMAGKKDGWNASFVRSDAVVDSLAER